MSVLKVDAIQDTSGNDQYTAKAWVNFKGTGTVAIRSNGNVSSITDVGTGVYELNYSASFSDTNYVTLGTVGSTTGAGVNTFILQTTTGEGDTAVAKTTSLTRMTVSTNASDAGHIYVVVTR